MTQVIRRLFERFEKKPPVTPLPATLERKRIYILPTRFGLLFMVVLTGMLLGSVNYNNNLGFLLTFLLGAMTFVSIFHTHKNLAGITVSSVRINPVFAGEPAAFEFIVRSPDSPRYAVSFHFSGGEKMTSDTSTGDESRISVSAPTLTRGMFRPGPMTIATRYPLGLFRAWHRLDAHIACPVYPPPIHGTPITGLAADTDGEDTRQISGLQGVDDFEGLKAYQPGDALQHISWKTFSKGQGMQTKTFVSQAGSAAIIDWNLINEPGTEKKLSILCGMILKADEAGLTFALRLPGQIIEKDQGDIHKHLCLKALALFGRPI